MTGQAIYAVGDVHGHLDKLRAAHDLIAADGGAGAQVVHLGDLLDRGPDSRGVVEYLMQGQAEGRPWLVIRGNHDRMLPGFLRDPLYVDSGFQSGRPWVLHPEAGAAETLEFMGLRAAVIRCNYMRKRGARCRWRMFSGCNPCRCGI